MLMWHLTLQFRPQSVFILSVSELKDMNCTAQRMDPQLRKLLEVAYEAWMDTGIVTNNSADSVDI
jgi:hypothetical protein